jgi:cytochrome c oxidase subunit 4
MAHEIRRFIGVWGALMALLALTLLAAEFELGLLNPVINLSIAAAKTGLIAWFFMHLEEDTALVRSAAIVAVVWLAILFLIGFADYLTRDGQLAA